MVFFREQMFPTAVTDAVSKLPGVEFALDRESAVKRFDLPSDRIGDIVVVGDKGTVVGTKKESHDLSQLGGMRLRSHGGLADSKVSFILSRKLNSNYEGIAKSRQLRNYDIFDFALNGVKRGRASVKQFARLTRNMERRHEYGDSPRYQSEKETAGTIATQNRVFRVPLSLSPSERILALPGNPGLISERHPVVLEFRIAHHHGPEGLVTLGERQGLLHWGIDISSGIEITCPASSEPQRERGQFQICESYYACCLSRWKGLLSVSHDQMGRTS